MMRESEFEIVITFLDLLGLGGGVLRFGREVPAGLSVLGGEDEPSAEGDLLQWEGVGVGDGVDDAGLFVAEVELCDAGGWGRHMGCVFLGWWLLCGFLGLLKGVGGFE